MRRCSQCQGYGLLAQVVLPNIGYRGTAPYAPMQSREQAIIYPREMTPQNPKIKFCRQCEGKGVCDAGPALSTQVTRHGSASADPAAKAADAGPSAVYEPVATRPRIRSGRKEG